ncbi:helix-turn-helix transcriptional regulator [bacterium]|nr:helix-turn-helix transcriptional regulator [bacterium]
MRNSKCTKLGFRSGNTLNTVLLTLLLEKPKIGYYLMDELEKFGFDKNNIPITIVYRALRNMEITGLTVSRWENTEGSPSKRVYYITNKGIQSLKEWKELAKEKLEVFNNLVEDIEKTLKNIGG